jgi:phosphatidylinositol alpha-1,6-mannosyltransferase
MTELRALVLTPDYPPQLGGIQVLVHRVVRYAPSMTTRVVTLDADGAPEFDSQHAIDVCRVRPRPRNRQASILRLNARALAEARSFRPDVVLSAHIITSPGAAAVRRVLGIPMVQYFHAKEVGAKPSLARFAATQADASIVVSRYTRQLAAGCGARPERLHRISPGVDLPEHRSEGSAEGPPTILTIARLEDRYKGHDVVMRALPLIRAHIPDVRWVIIGDGPLRSGLERLARAQGVADAVNFAGPVSDEERDDWLSRAHVFTMPSRLPAGGFAGEGFGIVYLEANARGVPVVAGNVGGALDAVEHEHTGLLVDPTDHLAIADAIGGLLMDRSRGAELGRNGAERARSFAWPRVAERVEGLLRLVAAGSAA